MVTTATFRMVPKKRRQNAAQGDGPAVPDTPASIAGQVGAAALSGLHTVGSVLSTPSRALWGAVNGLAGGEGGFGNMHPLDSTGGVELSHVLGNAGLIAKNDPNAWEWSDFGRGVVDMIGDPTSWVGVGGLTKAGVQAAKAGRLTKGVAGSIRAGERGLVSFHTPISAASHGAIGTGQAIGDAVERAGARTGLTRLAAKAAESAPVRHFNALMRSSFKGKLSAEIQKHAVEADAAMRAGQRQVDLNHLAYAMKMGKSGLDSKQAGEALRDAVEGVHGDRLRKYVQHPVANDTAGEFATVYADPRKLDTEWAKDTQGYLPRDAAGASEVPGRRDEFRRWLSEGNGPIQSPHVTLNDAGQLGFQDGRHRTRVLMDEGARAIPLTVHRSEAERIHSLVGADGVHPQIPGFAADLRDASRAAHESDIAHGYKTADLVDDVDFGARRLSEGAMKAFPSTDMAAKQNKLHHRQEELLQLGGTNSINRILMDPEADRVAQAVVNLPKNQQIKHVADVLKKNHGSRITSDVMSDGSSRLETLAAKMVHVPELRSQGLFQNNPIHDSHAMASAANTRAHNAQLLFKAVGDGLHADPHGTSVREFLDTAGFVPEAAAAHIAERTGQSVEDVLGASISDDLANELKSFTPHYKSPPAAKNTASVLKSLGTIWKASVLAHPASRVRDAAGGVIQNALMGHATPGGVADAARVARAAGVGAGKYGNLQEVADLMQRHGLNEDEAVRLLLAVEAPRSHGAVADVAPGQVGANLEDMLASVPGTTPSGMSDVLSRARKSLFQGELDRAGNPIATGSSLNPVNVAGAFGRESTAFGPAAASNVISGATDEFNRHAGILGQMQQGYEPSVAGARTRAAQVNYDPTTFTPTEQILKQVMPFYGFTSRMGAHTAGELASRPGGATAQLVKAEDRAQATDPSLPDHISQGTSIPLPWGQPDDGTKRYLTGLGLMHEPAVNMIGSALGGNTKGFGYDVLGMLNPLVKSPLEHVTGQSFYQRGEPAENLDPNVGRTLANLGVMAGLRSEDAGPVNYFGSPAVEMALQASPLSRAATTARQLTDTRKGAGAKLLNTATGLRVTDVSPQKQVATLRKRAEQAAKRMGAKASNNVYFSKAELAKLKEENPAAYAEQVQLQQFRNKLKPRKKASK